MGKLTHFGGMMELVKSKKDVKKQRTIRFSEEEFSEIINRAKKYAKGNLSRYVRYAALNFVPKKKDLTK